jgi:hypothetical protein
MVGLLGGDRRSRLLDVAGWAMLLGIVLFSGFLYGWLATGNRFFVYSVPFGGVAFIQGCLTWMRSIDDKQVSWHSLMSLQARGSSCPGSLACCVKCPCPVSA